MVCDDRTARRGRDRRAARAPDRHPAGRFGRKAIQQGHGDPREPRSTDPGAPAPEGRVQAKTVAGKRHDRRGGRMCGPGTAKGADVDRPSRRVGDAGEVRRRRIRADLVLRPHVVRGAPCSALELYANSDTAHRRIAFEDRPRHRVDLGDVAAGPLHASEGEVHPFGAVEPVQPFERLGQLVHADDAGDAPEDSQQVHVQASGERGETSGPT